jgi:hypothetical protein
MNDALRQLETLLSNAAAAPPRFPATSRYNGVATLVHTTPDGREIPYLARRFVPPLPAPATLRLHEVVQGDRLDLIAQRQLGDVELWWRLADANPTLAADTLTAVPGRALRVAPPDGLVGVPAAPRAQA